MKILISACLLGVNCRYSARAAEALPEVRVLMEKHTLIPVCPEQLGGLTTPREPSEICAGRVISRDGCDNTSAFCRGAEETLRLAKLFGCKYAVLKERSPSCGSGAVYDGSFSKTLMVGDGVTAALLKKSGITVLGESEIEKLL